MSADKRAATTPHRRFSFARFYNDLNTEMIKLYWYGMYYRRQHLL